MYRLFEILPGALIWLTFALMILFSWQFPAYVGLFIILYDVFWLMRTVYLFILLHVTFRIMRRNIKTDWLKKLNDLPVSDGQWSPPLAEGWSSSGGKVPARLKPGAGGGPPPAENVLWQDIYHLAVFPMYQEPYKLVEESFLRLRHMNYPKDKFIVVLATEEAGGEEAVETGRKIQEEFGRDFYRLLVTRHPSGLEGEIPGKGSNEAWATRRAKEEIIDKENIPYEKILVSVFDVDSQIFPDYFGILTYKFLTAPYPQRSSYQPIPLFTNNIFESPALARLLAFSSTFWNMMQQSRPENLVTFSSHSMPFKALSEIGFWHTHMVSEDSRVFWQCYIHYRGDWRTEPLFYPISMDANVAPTFWKTMRNIYKQQRRWAWGSENIAYIFTNFIKYRREIPKKFYWSFNTLEAFHSWATSALMIFFLGWLPIWLGGDNFSVTILSHNLPRITGSIMIFANIGIVSSAVLSVILLPPKPAWFRPWHYALYLLEWALMPLLFIFFASLPAIEAQTRLMLGGRWRLGFWVTPKTRKGVGET